MSQVAPPSSLSAPPGTLVPSPAQSSENTPTPGESASSRLRIPRRSLREPTEPAEIAPFAHPLPLDPDPEQAPQAARSKRSTRTHPTGVRMSEVLPFLALSAGVRKYTLYSFVTLTLAGAVLVLFWGLRMGSAGAPFRAPHVALLLVFVPAAVFAGHAFHRLRDEDNNWPRWPFLIALALLTMFVGLILLTANGLWECGMLLMRALHAPSVSAALTRLLGGVLLLYLVHEALFHTSPKSAKPKEEEH